MTIDQAVEHVIRQFFAEPWDDETRQDMSHALRKILPGPYEIEWELDEHGVPQILLQFKESPETTEWILCHR